MDFQRLKIMRLLIRNNLDELANIMQIMEESLRLDLLVEEVEPSFDLFT